MRTRFRPRGAAIGSFVVLLLICCSSTAAFGSKLRGSRSSLKTRRLNAAEEALFTEGRKGGFEGKGVEEIATIAVPKEGVASGPVEIPEDRKQKGESNTAVKVSNKEGGEAAKKARGEDYTSEDISEAVKDKDSSPQAVSYDDSTPEATSYDDSTPEATSYDDPQAESSLDVPESSLDVPESSTDDAKGAGKGSGVAKGKTVVSEGDAVLKESDLEPPVAKDDKGDKEEKGGKEEKEETEGKDEKDGKADKGDTEEPEEPRLNQPLPLPVETAPAPASQYYGETIPEYVEPDSTLAQVAFVMTQFGLEYRLGDGQGEAVGLPQTRNFAELEAATIAYLEEYVQLTYSGEDKMVFFESVTIEATSRRTGGSAGTPFIDFEANVAFLEDSPIIPTSVEISLTIAEALSGTNQATYLFTLAQRLSTGNPFLSTTQVAVYVPDPALENPRVSSSSTRMSSAGIAAAAGTGIMTLAIGAYLLFKIKNENIDINQKFSKGYIGGGTLAGDTYDATLAPSATMPPDDGRSLGSTLYNDDNSFDSSTPKSGGDKEENEDDVNCIDDSEYLNASKIRLANHVPKTKIGSYASLVGRTKAMVPKAMIPKAMATKAMVPAAEKSPQMSNDDIKNYFKSKYNCKSPAKSPRGYAVLDDLQASSKEDDDEDQASIVSDSNMRESLGLTLPALDHESVGAPQQMMDEEYYSEEEIFDDHASLPSDEGRIAVAAGESPQEEFEDEILPEISETSKSTSSWRTGTGTECIDKNLDDVSLGEYS